MKVIDISSYQFQVDGNLGLGEHCHLPDVLRESSWQYQDAILILMNLNPQGTHFHNDVFLKKTCEKSERAYDSLWYLTNGLQLLRLLPDENEIESYDTVGKRYTAIKPGDTVGEASAAVKNADEIDPVFWRIEEEIYRYFSIWMAELHPESNTPAYYVQWAIKKIFQFHGFHWQKK